MKKAWVFSVLISVMPVGLLLFGAQAAPSAVRQAGETLQVNIRLNAAPDKVWAAIVSPAQIKQWFLGVDTISDWRPGSAIVHRGQWQGKPYAAKGTILQFSPPRIFAHTHWSEMSGKPDRPENYQTVTYTLTSEGTGTELTVREENVPSPEAKQLSEETWRKVLQSLKELVEK